MIFKVFTQLPIYLLFYTFSSGTFPLFLKLFRFVVVNKKPADEETFINVDDTDSRRDEEMVISETQVFKILSNGMKSPSSCVF